ncbi:EamA family transporter [Methylocella sp.]|uniref:EamA family transporter n=1 Tax=Methylocella sp. TaxID=1978226 RepID=UPI003784D041
MENVIWIGATLLGAAGLTARNVAQRGLIAELGPAGAAYARFLYGAPFALLILPAVCGLAGEAMPRPSLAGAAWLCAGGVAQIAATTMTLALMTRRSFMTSIALTKTEPALALLFGVAFLGERLGAQAGFGVLVASLGVTLASRSPRAAPAKGLDAFEAPALGLGAAAGFAFSAVAFRAAILTFRNASFFVAASAALAFALALQAALIVALLLATNRPVLYALAREWRGSLAAGALGAFASLCWFVAFALQAAALVRALGLVETLFARLASRHMFGETASRAELAGAALIVFGVLILLLA